MLLDLIIGLDDEHLVNIIITMYVNIKYTLTLLWYLGTKKILKIQK